MEAWRAKIEAAAKPFHDDYKRKTEDRMSTDFEAIKIRNTSIKEAWVGIGIKEEDAEAALKRGSGAADWLVKKMGSDADADIAAAPAAAAAGASAAATSAEDGAMSKVE